MRKSCSINEPLKSSKLPYENAKARLFCRIAKHLIEQSRYESLVSEETFCGNHTLKFTG